MQNYSEKINSFHYCDPLVTVGVLCFNTGEYVIEAIRSVLRSDYKNLEIIVIDDCSTDGISSEMVGQFLSRYDSIRFIRHHKNEGIPRCFNKVLGLSSGKYLCFVCDDLITPQKIREDVILFEALGDGYGVVHSIAQTIDAVGNLYPEFSPTVAYPGLLPDSISVNDMIAQPFVNAITAMFRVRIVKEIGGWDETLLFEDFPDRMRYIYNVQ